MYVTSHVPVYSPNSINVVNIAVFVRGMYVAWSRIDPTSAIAQLIEAFLMVQVSTIETSLSVCGSLTLAQYNALLELASESDSYHFSWQWQGPPNTQLLPWGQAAALPVLNAAIGLVVGPTMRATSSTSSNQSPTASPTTTVVVPPGTNLKTSDTRLIIGLSVAAATVLLVATILAFRVWRRCSTRASDSEEKETLPQSLDSTVPDDGIEPFTLENIPSEYANHPPKSTSKETAGLFLTEPRSNDIPQIDHEVSFGEHDIPDTTLPGRSHLSIFRPLSTSDPTPIRIPRPVTSAPTRARLERDPPISTQPLEMANGSDIDEGNDDPSALPALIRELNRALARLPDGEIPIEEGTEPPPEYQET